MHAEDLDIGHLNGPAGIVIVKPRPFLEQPDQKELRGQRRNRQIEPLDPQAGQAEHHSHGGRKQTRGQHRHQKVHLGKDRDQLVTRIGPHPHERACPKAQLPGIARQDVQPRRRQRIDQHRDQKRLERELAGGKRQDCPGEDQDQPQKDRILPDRKQRLVAAIGRLELARGAIKHQRSPTTSTAHRHLNGPLGGQRFPTFPCP